MGWSGLEQRGGLRSLARRTLIVGGTALLLAWCATASSSARALGRTANGRAHGRETLAACKRRVRKRHRSPRECRHEGGVPLNAHKLPSGKPVQNIGGAIPPDQFLPFEAGKRIYVSQGALAPCRHGYDHAPTSCNSYYGPYNQYAWDFAVPVGTPIHAAVGGVVVRAGWEEGGYGNTLLVQTARGDCSRYEHLSTINVHVGQTVSTYDLIAASGATGHVTGPHLHYGREDCRTGISLQSSFIDIGNPAMGSTVTSGNHGGAFAPVASPASCPPHCFVYGASEGVNVRKGPSLTAPVLTVLPNGSAVEISCQTTGDSVHGSAIWDRVAGGYVADYYINTPVTGAFSPGLSECHALSSEPPPSSGETPPKPVEPPPAFYVHHVKGTCADGACGLKEHTGPGYSSYPTVGAVAEGAEVQIVCQTSGEFVTPIHGTGSSVWDKLLNGAYVTDVYIDTPGIGGAFSPPIPQC